MNGKTPEQKYLRGVLHDERTSVLATDGYKLSMAQAGFPLREETFVLSFRREGAQLVPFDLEQIVQGLLPNISTLTMKQRGFLEAHGYGLTGAMEQALRGTVRVNCIPKGGWVLPGEPVLTVTGPSFLVSWLEPLLLMLHYPCQVATAIKTRTASFKASCFDEALIIEAVVEALGEDVNIEIDSLPYRDAVRCRACAIKAALQGDTSRAFEVGMRAATCLQQHEIVLKIWQEEGFTRTSNVLAAYNLNMYPVGTTGHEHQMRWMAVAGRGDDKAGYRAIRDMRPEMPSYLFDTLDPEVLGIPAIEKIVAEDPYRCVSCRFDSGNQNAQWDLLLGIFYRRRWSYPLFIFEDGYNTEKTIKNEALRQKKDIAEFCVSYGYGGYAVALDSYTPFTRDRVSAAYKLSETGGVSVMKWSGSLGKESLPGMPVVFRRVLPDGPYHANHSAPLSMIGQEGETVPEGFVLFNQTAKVPQDIDLSMVTQQSPLSDNSDSRKRRVAQTFHQFPHL